MKIKSSSSDLGWRVALILAIGLTLLCDVRAVHNLRKIWYARRQAQATR